MLRLRAILSRRGLESDMQEEMRLHLERATERLIARGLSPAAARLAARREFGNVTVLQEDARDARGMRWVDALAGDLHFAFRYFSRNKPGTAIIIAVLALGIGANTVIFSLVQAQFRRPAPAVPDDASHVRIHLLERKGNVPWQPIAFSQPALSALASRRETFRDVAGFLADDVVLDAGDSTGARGVRAQFVTPNFFDVVGVALVAGQGFARHHTDGADMGAVLAFATAEQLYGDVRHAIGRRILVNELSLGVVGVAPPRFQGAFRDMDEPALWIPVSARADIARIPTSWPTDSSALLLFARLAPDVSPEQAEAIAGHVVARTLPDSAARAGISRMAWVRDMQDPVPGPATTEAYLAMTAIATVGLLILLVACTNVSSLMVAAAVGRRQEIAVRLSLGASRARLLRLLVTESTLLSVAGGAVGLTLGWWLLMWMETTEFNGVNIMPDAGTLVFMMALAVGTGVLFGLSPALHATRGNLLHALRDSGTGATPRSRLQRAFVVAQIAFSQPLLVMLGVLLSLAISDYRPLSRTVSERIARITFQPLTRTGGPGQRREAVDSLIPRIASHAEVVAVVPEAAAFTVRNVVVRDRIGANETADTAATMIHLEGAAPGWFALLDVPIVMGRDVSLADTAARDYPVVIGSDYARILWGEANPIGRTLASPPFSGRRDSINLVVVGVFDVTRQTTRGNQMTRLYTARGKQWRRDMLLVRTRGAAESFLPQLRRTLRAEAPGLPVTRTTTIALIDEQERLITLRLAGVAAAGAALALLLASLGLYGVVSLAVRQRTREIGIRIAVGAKPVQVARMFLASGVRVGIVALLIGLPLTITGLSLALSQQVVIAPQVNPWLIGTGVAVILLAVAFAATWLPARRAASVDPARTLRVE